MIQNIAATQSMHPQLRAAVQTIERVHTWPRLAINAKGSTHTFCAIGVLIDVRGAIDYAGADKIITDILRRYKKILPSGLNYKPPGLTINTHEEKEI